jgi:hypothetical protein
MVSSSLWKIGRVWDLAPNLEAQDGYLWINGAADQHTMVFTERGIDCLCELISDLAQLAQNRGSGLGKSIA